MTTPYSFRGRAEIHYAATSGTGKTHRPTSATLPPGHPLHRAANGAPACRTGRRLDEKVDQRIYDLRHEALASRVTTLETLREKDAEKLVATRRWLIGAVIVPLIGIMLPLIVLLIRGAGP